MKKGQEIKNMLTMINDDSDKKNDYIVRSKSLKVVENEHDTFPSLNFNDYQTRLTDTSVLHLANRMNIGTSYISKCMPFQSLVAYNLNHWIDVNKDKGLMIRNTQDKTRAILSDRYKRIDCKDVANASLDRLMDMNAELKYSYYDGDRMNITAVLPKLEGAVEKDDIVQGGITITNSEVGGGSLIIKPFIYRLVCTNGMVAPSYLNQFYAKHVGRMIIDPDKDEQWKSIVSKMEQQLDLVSNPEVFEENLMKLTQSTEEKINSHQIIALAKKQGVSDEERAGIFERLDHYVGEDFVTSKYKLANAITNLANDEAKSDDRARFLQELGGLVVFSNNPVHARI